MLSSQVGLQLWKTLMPRWMLIMLGIQTEGISKFNQRESKLHELKKHKPWFAKGCSELLDKMKEDKIAVVTGFK
jgi:hypothetical protein